MSRYHVRRDPPLPWIVIAALILHLFFFDTTSIGVLADATPSSTPVEESANLVFSTQFQLLSQPLCQDAKELRQFLERNEIRDLFLSAGGEQPCTTVPKDETMMRLFREASTRHYGPDALSSSSSEEEETVDMLATETTTQFPAFKIITTAVNACRRVAPGSSLVGSSSDHPHSFGLVDRIFHHHQQQQEAMNPERFQGPVHRFYLVAERKRWEGPKALVGRIRRWTGEDSNKDTTTKTPSPIKSFQSSDTRAVTQISVVALVPSSADPSTLEPTSNNNRTSETKQTHYYGFQIDIDCAIRMEFPKLLFRFMPTSRSQVEERGTKAVHDALLKHASSALEAVQTAWRREQEQQMQQTGTTNEVNR